MGHQSKLTVIDAFTYLVGRGQYWSRVDPGRHVLVDTSCPTERGTSSLGIPDLLLSFLYTSITLHYIKFRVQKCISTSVTLQITEKPTKNCFRTSVLNI